MLAWDLEPSQPSSSPAPGREPLRACNWRLSILNRAARSFTPFRPVSELGLIQSRRFRAALMRLPSCSATAHFARPLRPRSRTILSGISVFVCAGSPTPKFHSSHGWGRQVQYPETGRPLAHAFRFYSEFPLYQTRPGYVAHSSLRGPKSQDSGLPNPNPTRPIRYPTTWYQKGKDTTHDMQPPPLKTTLNAPR